MIDVHANRKSRKWPLRVQVARVLWAIAQPAFRFSPRPLWGWRRALLRLFGAQIGSHVHLHPTVRITMPWNLSIGAYTAVGDRSIIYALGRIEISERVTVSQGAHLCAGSHDWRQPEMPLLKLPITVHEDAWICADAFIGPNITIGPRAIVAARAVAVRDVAADSIVAGNPARLIKHRKSSTLT